MYNIYISKIYCMSIGLMGGGNLICIYVELQ